MIPPDVIADVIETKPDVKADVISSASDVTADVVFADTTPAQPQATTWGPTPRRMP